MSMLAAGAIAPPLDEDRTRRIRDAVHGLSAAELQWVSGYVAGLAATAGAPDAASAAAPGKALTVLYGSQTGNGQGIAEGLAGRAREQGFAVSLVSLADYKPANLKRESLVAFVVSTHGEGDPPDDAEMFHEFLLSKKAPKLDGLRYTVLALGDSSYINYCQTGREFDERLRSLGAEPLLPLVECDLDYEDPAARWSGELVAKLPDVLHATAAVPHLRAVQAVARFDRKNPFPAEVLLNQKITGRDSSKDVRHIELSLEGSGLAYEPGDSLAVAAENPPRLVDDFIALFGGDGDTQVDVGGDKLRFADALSTRLEITAPSLGFLRAWAGYSAAQELATLLAAGRQAELTRFVDSHQIIDVVRRFPADVGPAGFAASLRKLSPRSYSIASSARANPDEVHLTVAAVRYQAFGSEHWGAASTHLADRLAEGDRVSVYVEPNPRFRLPADDDIPVIMIGPGTGVAPFRAFVEERAERGARGRNWLFFGDRCFSSDFLYQLEWQRHLKQGSLHRMDVAFSRDQRDKVYVQHRLAERGRELCRWIDDGAAIYVCGDAKRMAGDVHDALAGILAAHRGLDREGAENRLRELRRAGRYQRDVY